MKRKPKKVYVPPKILKPAKRGKSDNTGITTEPTEGSSELGGFYHKVSIKRTSMTAEDVVALPSPPIPKKRLKPYSKEDKGFNKYFGSLDEHEGSQSMYTEIK